MGVFCMHRAWGWALLVGALAAACAEGDGTGRDATATGGTDGSVTDRGSSAGSDGGVPDGGAADTGASVCGECTAAGSVCDEALAACVCPSGGERCTGPERACTELGCVDAPTASCTGGTAWAAGTSAFRDATEMADLTGVQGVRLNVLHLNDDGYPDLFVRFGGTTADDFGPEGNRRSWVLRNRGDGTFEDVTESSGLRARRNGPEDEGHPGDVVASADVDNDGDMDVFVGIDDNLGSSGSQSNELYLNRGDGTFELAPESVAIRQPGRSEGVSGAAFVDFNRDQWIDLFVGRNAVGSTIQRDRLYEGLGSGFFVEVTEDVGLATEPWVQVSDLNQARAHSRAWSVTACDLNDDGTTELLAASYGRAPNLLWQGERAPEDGSVRFENRSIASGYAFDDNQEWRDNQFARCFCAADPNAPGCSSVPAPNINCGQINWRHAFDREPFRLGGNSGTTVCADVNNDGNLDLLTTEITHWWAGSGSDRSQLLLNTGEDPVRFDRIPEDASGIDRPNEGSWDQGDITAAVFDFDNDAWPDVYIGATDYPGNRGLLYRQSEPGQFTAVPPSDGIDHFRSHGVAVADFDRDGDLDLVAGHSRARCGDTGECQPTRQVRYFENRLGDRGNWLQLELVGGPRTNRSAIGARVTVRTDQTTQTQEVGGGHGHYGIQHDTTLHFGLGAACEAEVEIRWPDRELTVERFDAVSGVRYRVEQGKAPEVLFKRSL